ncbi:glycosyltransferase family protein [Nisaea sediminum]|uniref:hypothetical protein n=1 Tax=Nisaea sediminum TaxID=2775867 RepID=UPI00186888EB|nr:hypothetical protein [Nisaea sediminum]
MIGFVLTEGEVAREEKLAFYRSQTARLGVAGVEAQIFKFTGAVESLPEPGWLVVFDVNRPPALQAALDESGHLLAPLVWNPYAFFGGPQARIRKSAATLAVIVPGEPWRQKLSRYRLGKHVLGVKVTTDFPGRESGARQSAPRPVSRIGYFSAGKSYLAHIRGSVTRIRQDFADLEWVEMDYENPVAWRRAVPECDLFLSMRGLCGSALPLLDLMAAGVIVCGTHSGGLSEVATAENGLWVDSATADRFVEVLMDGLARARTDPEWRRSLAENARATALALDADATFETNLPIWKQLLTLAASRS